jgi:hypothetical protein
MDGSIKLVPNLDEEPISKVPQTSEMVAQIISIPDYELLNHPI